MKQKVNKEKYIKFSVIYMFINLMFIGLLLLFMAQYNLDYKVVIVIIAIYIFNMMILEEKYFSKYYLENKDE